MTPVDLHRRRLFVTWRGASHDRNNFRHSVPPRRRQSCPTPEAHNLDAIGYLEDVGHVVADENDGQSAIANGADQVQYLTRFADSQSGSRLIHDNQATRENCGSSHRYSLTLSAREFLDGTVYRRKMKPQFVHFPLRFAPHPVLIQQPEPGPKLSAPA
jgi:hypothetical protein